MYILYICSFIMPFFLLLINLYSLIILTNYYYSIYIYLLYLLYLRIFNICNVVLTIDNFRMQIFKVEKIFGKLIYCVEKCIQKLCEASCRVENKFFSMNINISKNKNYSLVKYKFKIKIKILLIIFGLTNSILYKKDLNFFSNFF